MFSNRIIAAAAGLLTAASMYAEGQYIAPSIEKGWSFGLDGGVTTPMKHHAFMGDMRGWVGAHLQKQISPAFALGVESYWGVNTSSWTERKHAPAFDNSYTGVYGAIDLTTLTCGFKCEGRVFGLELAAGAGFGHEYDNDGPNNTGPEDRTYFATKAGFNFNFNVNRHVTLSLRPALIWNMTGTEGLPLGIEQTSAGYNGNLCTFNVTAGVAYHFGEGIRCVSAMDNGEINDLNAKVNAMRGELADCMGVLAAEEARMAELNSALAQCRSKAPVKESLTGKETILYVYYELASPVIRESQQPVVEMVADYLKNHPKANVIIKGFASEEGEEAFNERLSAERADAVRTMLQNKYGIAADRIKAEGCGILTQFKELSWNRVAICILTLD
ncbi:MAG: OmpA family protein [Muribaculaceae bacterium]|nr:OmpA family protein [Muribaculaceae bacterium]